MSSSVVNIIAVNKAISNICKQQQVMVSLHTLEFLTNIKILIQDYQDNKIEKVKAWFELYNFQAMNAHPYQSCPLHPSTLNAQEIAYFSQDINTIKTIVESIKNSL